MLLVGRLPLFWLLGVKGVILHVWLPGSKATVASERGSPNQPTPQTASAPQGTKACLGWDRSNQAAVVTTGTTAVVDLWLQLLLAALQVCARCASGRCWQLAG